MVTTLLLSRMPLKAGVMFSASPSLVVWIGDLLVQEGLFIHGPQKPEANTPNKTEKADQSSSNEPS